MDGAPAAVLLASGRGSRFDPSGVSNKLLARLSDGRPVLRASAETLLGELDSVVVVVPTLHAELRRALDGLRVEWIVNERSSHGMGTSIARGVAATANARGWLIALGDMPFVSGATIRALVAALGRGASIVAPRFMGERGHPVGFAAEHFAALSATSGDTGARELLERRSIEFVDVADSGILSDIDTPGDLPR